jgi:membrane associated rhomboid family serine protease
MPDGNYMGNPLRDSRSWPVSAVMIIMIANVLVFFIQKMTETGVDTPMGSVMSDKVTEALALVSTDVRNGQVYRLFSYMFVHGGFAHIFFNMWGLYLFGSLLESRIGAARFFNLYVISGLCGAGLWMLSNWNSSIPCLGASGAVFGIIIATAMFFPDLRIMLLLPPIPMKLKTFAIVFAVLEVFFELTGTQRGVAHLAHLGGFLGGYLYIRMLYKNEVWDIFSFLKSGKSKTGEGMYSMNNPPPGWNVSDKVSQAELDRILDKMSLSGINSLTETEMETLRKAREQMRAEREG